MSSDIVPHAGGALSIDDGFRSLIPPLTDDEYRRLEASIIAEGVRDPIITWNGTIVDGHNRYRICQEHGIAFKTAEIVFDSKDAAKIWIIENQFGRRNLNSYQKSVLALQLEPLYAAEAKRKQIRKPESVRQNFDEQPPLRTDERLAQIAGVSRGTLRKVKAIETEADKGNPVAIEARQKLMDGGSSSIHGAYVAVTGDRKPRTHEESSTTDGRRICAMCGEPIDEGDANPSRPTIHKRCEKEYQRDWERAKRRSPDLTLSSNVAVFTPMTLLAELSQSADEFGRSVRQSLEINEENGAALTARQRKRLIRAVDNINAVINGIAKEYRDA
ncbi:MAG: ParB N-terminal domain-containing protein [Kiritimatiellae bacterium]|nr:ParB N-terminal domain-containing protein [Kiritimatiellia bacterium]